MEETLALANSPMMWILALSIIGVVVVQLIIFYRLARTMVKETNILTGHEVRSSFKVGAVSTIGPAMAVFAIAVALIAQVGGPITLSRVGVIGSAVFEMIAARIGSGGTVGTPEFTESMLASASRRRQTGRIPSSLHTQQVLPPLSSFLPLPTKR